MNNNYREEVKRRVRGEPKPDKFSGWLVLAALMVITAAGALYWMLCLWLVSALGFPAVMAVLPFALTVILLLSRIAFPFGRKG